MALLLGEGLGLGLAFDSETVLDLPRGWWTPVLGLLGGFMPASAVLLAAVALVWWARGRGVLASSADAANPPRRWLPYLALHLVSFAVLVALSRALFEGGSARATPGPLVAGWLYTVALTLAAWVAAMLPRQLLVALARQRGPLLAGAVVLAGMAFALGRLAQGLWLPLRRATFAAGSAALGAVASGVFSDPATLTFGTDAFAVEIAPQCSGYEGVGLTWAFVLAALWLFRDRFRFPRAFVLLLLATVVPWLANVARLVALVLVGTHLSPELAAGGFHSYAGSILFCAVALGVVALGLHLPWMTCVPPDGHAQAQAHAHAAPAYVVPFLVLTAAGLVSRAFSTPDVEPLYLMRPAAGALALLAFLGSYRRQSWRVSALAVPAGLAVAGAWLLFDRALPSAGGAAGGAHAQSSATLIARAATAVLLVPPIEELAFRGFLARRISSRDFDRLPAEALSWTGVIVSGLAFGLLHRRIVAGVVAGIAYGAIYRVRGRLADAVVAHAATNAALVAVAWATGAWDLWR